MCHLSFSTKQWKDGKTQWILFTVLKQQPNLYQWPCSANSEWAWPYHSIIKEIKNQTESTICCAAPNINIDASRENWFQIADDYWANGIENRCAAWWYSTRWPGAWIIRIWPRWATQVSSRLLIFQWRHSEFYFLGLALQSDLINLKRKVDWCKPCHHSVLLWCRELSTFPWPLCSGWRWCWCTTRVSYRFPQL